MAGRKRAVLHRGAENPLPPRTARKKYSYLPWVDCICAGVPCQDVSVAGKRQGLRGERTGLFYEFARILREIRPTWFVFENVPGLLSSNEGRDFAEIQRVLMVECGYGICWRILNSQFFGVAQRRRRVFIVGYLGKPCPAQILFESEGGSGKILRRAERRGRILPSHLQAALESLAMRRDEEEKMTLISSQPHSPVTGDCKATETETTCKCLTDSVDRGDLMAQLKISSREVCKPTGNGTVTRCQRNRPQKPGTSSQLLNTGGAAGGFRSEPGEHLISETANSNRVRESTSLPAGLDSARYRALGNAVTTVVARWIADRIRRYELGEL